MADHIADVAEEWLELLSATGRTKKTIQTYRDTLRSFSLFLAETDRSTEVTDITRETILAYYRWMDERGNRAGTKMTRHTMLSSLFSYLVDERILDASPMTRIPKPKGAQKDPTVLTDDQITAFLKACEGKDFLDHRDLAIAAIAFDTGARLGEISSLQHEEVLVTLPDLILVMRGKTGERIVPVGAVTRKYIRRYLRAREGHKNAELPALWLGQQKELTTHAIALAMYRRARKAGIPNWHMHSARHSFAHGFLTDGGQTGDLMQITGWKNPATAMIYARTTAAARAREAHKLHSPVDRLARGRGR